MEPASTIIDRLGGVTKVAQVVGVHRTRVSNWKRARQSGGTDGRIPQGYHVLLLQYARDHGVPLSADDFLPAASSPSALPESACEAAARTSEAAR